MIAGMQASAVDPIDTRQFGFLSYAPPVGVRLGMEEALVSVEAEIGDRLVENMAQARVSFPLRPGKIQRPLLPNDTLRRDRLLGWLGERSDKRLVYVAAEAGFGKTTLVADFLRRSRIRTFWYRLDDDDTDGLVFLRYLIASCQSVDPRLLSRSANLLSQPSLEPARQEDVLETVVAEMDCLGEVPSAVVLDDYHRVEHVASIGAVVERLIARAPAGLTVFVVSRRTPSLAIAAVRARGELAEIGRDELRFIETETDELFRVSYNHPLEPDVLHDLQLRTDGWAASLQLVKAAVEHRQPGQVRSFVRTLTGAEGALYDFLAEEVVGELPPELRDFLMRVALLEETDPETAAVAAATPQVEARRLLAQAQRLGLISKGVGAIDTWRQHPLVREFLLARLELEVGQAGVVELHRGLAAALEPQSWRLAARHWAAAGDADEVRRVLCAAVATIIGTGDLVAASDLITRFPDPDPNPWYDILQARLHSYFGRHDEALELALQAARYNSNAEDANTPLSLLNGLNLLYYGVELRDPRLRAQGASRLLRSSDPELAAIARATQALVDAAERGSLDHACRAILEAAELSAARKHHHHESIAWTNMSSVERARGNAASAVDAGLSALRCLVEPCTPSDLQAAHINVARGLADSGKWDEAKSHVDAALASRQEWIDPQAITESAELHAMYGGLATAEQMLHRAIREQPNCRLDPVWCAVSARLKLRAGQAQEARQLLEGAVGPTFATGFRSSWLALDAAIRAQDATRGPTAKPDFGEAIRLAEGQQAWYWAKTIQLTEALLAPDDTLVAHLRGLDPDDATYLSPQAELVSRRISDLDTFGLTLVREEALRIPERWRHPLRKLMLGHDSRAGDTRRAAELLDLIGEIDDVKTLRMVAHKKSLHIPDAGKALSRRLAEPIYVDDLGRLVVHVGTRAVQGTDIRKKVLSLLAYLLTRPQFTASREQVIEALWPHMTPEAGANSLNQTSYFLRQVFEPTADDDSSAGYLNSRADLIWLDADLVQSRSTTCLQLLTQIRRDSSPELVTRLSQLYTGRFGVDFLYEDWASAFRDNLHAGVLDRLERAVTADTAVGAFDRALSVVQMALQVDPDADQLELCLLRLYRRMGAHAAAAEQYAHYSSVMRDQLGIEPPPLDSI
jgi:ATP/maltotriose-dependent transcriptional regulator MalT/DNA-binding SARP family transcriptional activator